MGPDALLRLGVDDGAEVGGEVPGVAGAKLGHGAAEHVQDGLGHLLLEIQAAEGGAALAGGAEGGGEDVADGLLGQGGGVHHHGVDAAGLGDEGAAGGPAAMARRMRWAVAVEPVKATPDRRGSEVSAAPVSAPPGRNWSAVTGTPASRSHWTARWAMSGVCGAGLARTALPMTRAAAIWPVKMARGKFQGEMQAQRPWPASGWVRSASLA
jgi:hypothetical protein